jgi:hypothetical protein
VSIGAGRGGSPGGEPQKAPVEVFRHRPGGEALGELSRMRFALTVPFASPRSLVAFEVSPKEGCNRKVIGFPGGIKWSACPERYARPERYPDQASPRNSDRPTPYVVGSFLQSHSGSVFERAEALIPALYDWRVNRP